MPHGGLDAAEAKLVGALVKARARETNSFGVAACCELIDGPAAGITKAHHLGHLVEGLARSVVASATQMNVVTDAVHAIEQCMPTGRKQSDVRKWNFMFEMDGQQMGFEMIDADVGNARAKRHALDQGKADEQRPDQAGSVSDGDAVQLLQFHICFL